MPGKKIVFLSLIISSILFSGCKYNFSNGNGGNGNGNGRSLIGLAQ